MGKVDPVAQNRIQAEFIEKELKSVSLRTDFTLNVRRMANELVSDKVTMSPRGAQQPGTSSGEPPSAAQVGGGGGSLASAGRNIMGGNTTDVAAVVPPLLEEGLLEDLKDQIRRPKKTPRQIYNEPMTSSMRIGWDLGAREMSDFRTSGSTSMRWRRPKVSTELSNYCNLYCKMYGVSPYAKGLQAG